MSNFINKYMLLSCSYSIISGINHIYMTKNNMNNDDKLCCLIMKFGMSPICFPLYLYNDYNGNNDLAKLKNYMDYVLAK
jgi:hypothetical protein